MLIASVARRYPTIMAASSPELLIVKPYGTSLGAINGETGTEQGFIFRCWSGRPRASQSGPDKESLNRSCLGVPAGSQLTAPISNILQIVA